MDHNNNDVEALRKMSKLVNSLLARADCGPFREPVDWRGLELYDYPKIIKKMMDLGTVKRKLERNQYKNAAECAEDIRLIWTNCKTYNADGSDFYLLAETFSKRFEDRYKKVRAEFDTGDNGSSNASSTGGSSRSGSERGGSVSTPSLELRTKFGSSLYRLSGMELGHVIQVLDLQCPQALEVPCAVASSGALSQSKKRTVEDEADVEINVDLIDSQTFAQLDRYVREKVNVNGRGGKGGGVGGSGAEAYSSEETESRSGGGGKRRKK